MLITGSILYTRWPHELPCIRRRIEFCFIVLSSVEKCSRDLSIIYVLHTKSWRWESEIKCQHTTFNSQRSTVKPQLPTLKSQLSIRNWQLSTWNLQLSDFMRKRYEIVIFVIRNRKILRYRLVWSDALRAGGECGAPRACPKTYTFPHWLT